MWSNGRADSIEPRINWHFKWESEAEQRRAMERRAGGNSFTSQYIGSHVEAQNGWPFQTVFGLCGEYYITDVIGKNEHCLTSFVHPELKETAVRLWGEASWNTTSCRVFGWKRGHLATVLSPHSRESYPEEALKMALRHRWYQSGFQWNEIAQLGEDKRLSCEERRVYCRYASKVNILLALTGSYSHFWLQFCQIIDVAALH